MAKVYFKSIDSYSKTEEINAAAAKLLKIIEKEEKVELSKFIPIKVHLGEKGNKTFYETNSQGHRCICFHRPCGY
jgi:uncharacterized protein